MGAAFHESGYWARYKNKRLYRVSSYYLARTTGELPLQLFFPFLYVAIIYPMVGYNAEAQMFFLLVVTLLLACFTGCSYGYLLSTLSTDFEVAMSLSIVFLVSLFLFSGMMTSAATIPVFLRWVGNISLFKWSFNAGIVCVWEGVQLECLEGYSKEGFVIIFKHDKNVVRLGCPL